MGKPGVRHTEDAKRRISETKRHQSGRGSAPLVPQLCACGCGEYAGVDERRNIVRKYVLGHQARVQLDESGLLACRECRRKLPLSEFHELSTTFLGHRTVCKECTSERAMAWADANPDRVLDTRLRKKFGIALEQYTALLAEQGGVCAICGEPPAIVNYRQSRRQGRQTRPRLVVDHDHATGKVRGLLCVHCNRGIGFLKDNPDIVRFALKYLEERNG
ncbi:MAG TPA: endonuclease VII domain-containing protein [Acetobacteraceae bacterium]